VASTVKGNSQDWENYAPVTRESGVLRRKGDANLKEGVFLQKIGGGGQEVGKNVGTGVVTWEELTSDCVQRACQGYKGALVGAEVVGQSFF